MSRISSFDSVESSCVGRDSERTSLLEFVESTELGVGLDIVAIYGLGGIGKTTLSRAAVGDFLAQAEGSTALAIDCVTLPAPPDMASLFRALDGASGSLSPLTTAGARLDRVATLIRSSPTPSNTDPGVWLETRRRALELLTFSSATAIETMAFGSTGDSATKAMVSGAQTVAAAGSALGQVVHHLLESERMDDEDAAVALDPDSFLVSSLAEFFAAVSKGERLLLSFDKAENLSPRLFRLAEIMNAAAQRAQIRVTLLLAGRLTQIQAPDGSDLAVPEFLEAAAASSLGIELTPFDAVQVEDLLKLIHRRLYDTDPGQPVPRWLSQAITRVSGGLPLWAASVSEALLTTGPTPWANDDPDFRALLPADADFETTVTRIFRELKLDPSRSAFPLLIALAIAPGDAPHEVVCAAAQLPEDSFAEIRDRFSFMRADRLHDTARTVLRHHLATSPDMAAEVARCARVFVSWLESKAPTDSPLDSDSAWARYAVELVGLRFWLGVDTGIWAAADFLLTGMPTDHPWTQPILEESAWFLERKAGGEVPRRLLSNCVKAVWPVVMSDLLGGDATAGDRGGIRASVGSAAQTGSYGGTLGRYLDEIDRILASQHDQISKAGHIGSDALRLRWLTRQGFDDDGYDLALSLAERLAEVPESAPVRRHVAESLFELLKANAEWAVAEAGDERVRRQTRVETLATALVGAEPVFASAGVGRTIALLGATPQMTDALKTLSQDKVRRGFSRELVANVSNAQLYLGDYEEAAQLLRRGLARAPDWIGGTVNLVRALICLERPQEAEELAIDQLRGPGKGERKLSDHGQAVRRQLSDYLAVALILRGLHGEELKSTWAEHDLEPTRWGEVLLTLFTADASDAFLAIESSLQDGARQEDLAIEAAIALDGLDRAEDAERAMAMWLGTRRPAHIWKVERMILRQAYEVGLTQRDRSLAGEGDDGSDSP